MFLLVSSEMVKRFIFTFKGKSIVSYFLHNKVGGESQSFFGIIHKKRSLQPPNSSLPLQVVCPVHVSVGTITAL